MKVSIERDVVRDQVRIYVHGPDHIGRLTDDGLVFDPIEPGLIVQPTLTLPHRVLEQLVAAATNVVPASSEQAAALKDTREVRDKLLDLVTHVITVKP